jgi:hypothetical protein
MGKKGLPCEVFDLIEAPCSPPAANRESSKCKVLKPFYCSLLANPVRLRRTTGKSSLKHFQQGKGEGGVKCSLDLERKRGQGSWPWPASFKLLVFTGVKHLFQQAFARNSSLRADRFEKLELSFVANPNNDGTLQWVALFGKGHLTCDAVKCFDLGQSITNTLAVLVNLAGNLATIFDGLLNKAQ